MFLVNCNSNSVVPKYLNFRLATKSLKTSRTYQQCPLRLLHEEVCQKKANMRMLRKEFETEARFIDFAHVRPHFLGHKSKVLKHKSNIQQQKQQQQKKINNLFRDKKPQHDAH